MRTLLFLGLLLVGTPAFAQTTDPCAGTSIPTSYRISTSTVVTLGWCSLAIDNIDAVAVYINEKVTNLTTLNRVTTTPNANGMHYYTVVAGLIPAGSHQLTLRTYNKSTVDGTQQMSGPSSPLALTVVIPNSPPAVPAFPRVILPGA